MSLSAYLIAVTPDEYHVLSRSKRRLVKLWKSSDFENHNFLEIGAFWYPTYCILGETFPNNKVLDQAILGGKATIVKIDGSNIHFRYLPSTTVTLISNELNNISFEQLKKTLFNFTLGENNRLNVPSHVNVSELAPEIEMIFHQLADFYSRCAKSGQALILFLR